MYTKKKRVYGIPETPMFGEEISVYLPRGVNNLNLVLLSMVSQRLCEGSFDGGEIRVHKHIFDKLDHHRRFA